jgi:hypothetical protein
MGRGGKRPGAGRKRGTANIKSREIADAAAEKGTTPLQYMLSVVNDANAAEHRRDSMAVASAAFCHPRLNAVATVNPPEIPGCINSINIFAIPRGAQVDPQTGLITYPDGTVGEAPPFEPYRPTPELPPRVAPTWRTVDA